jgi:hypothetical protein
LDRRFGWVSGGYFGGFVAWTPDCGWGVFVGFGDRDYRGCCFAGAGFGGSSRGVAFFGADV